MSRNHILVIFVIFSTFFNTFGNNLFAGSVSAGGFIALDLMAYRNESGKTQTVNTGIGVLDLKIYANKDKFGAKLKLDLDDSHIGDPFNIFEEVTASYRHSDNIKLKIGKGVVPFHRKHWGVIQNCYIDSGSVIGTKHAWRDQDNKLLTSVSLGSKSKGHISHLTYYGDSKDVEYDYKTGLPKEDNYGNFEYENRKTFSSKKQRGFAYKLELFPTSNLDISFGSIYFHHDLNPKENFAFDFGGKYKLANIEIWFEFVHGFTSTAEQAKHPALKLYETLGEIGFEYGLAKDLSLLFNTGILLVDRVNHDWSEDIYDNYKVDVGLGFYLAKKSLLTVGTLFERQQSAKAGVSKPDRNVWELAAKFSFWF